MSSRSKSSVGTSGTTIQHGGGRGERASSRQRARESTEDVGATLPQDADEAQPSTPTMSAVTRQLNFTDDQTPSYIPSGNDGPLGLASPPPLMTLTARREQGGRSFHTLSQEEVERFNIRGRLRDFQAFNESIHDAQVWIDDFELRIIRYQGSARVETLAEVLVQYTADARAARKLLAVSAEAASWNELREIFIELFTPRATRRLREQELARIRMMATETIYTLTRRIEGEVAKIISSADGIENDDRIFLSTLTSALGEQPELKACCLENSFRSRTELIEVLAFKELALKATKKQEAGTTAPTTAQATTTGASVIANPTSLFVTGNPVVHTIAAMHQEERQQEQKKTCFFCGKPGHIKVNCRTRIRQETATRGQWPGSRPQQAASGYEGQRGNPTQWRTQERQPETGFNQRPDTFKRARVNNVNTMPTQGGEEAKTLEEMIAKAVAEAVKELQTKTIAGVKANKSSLMKIHGVVTGAEIPMLVDSGADASLVKTSTATKLKLEIKKGNTLMVLGGAFGEEPAEVADGIATATFMFPDGTACTHEFIVAKNCAFEFILGLDILDKMEAVALFGTSRRLSVGGKAPFVCEAIDSTGYNHVSVRGAIEKEGAATEE